MEALVITAVILLCVAYASKKVMYNHQLELQLAPIGMIQRFNKDNVDLHEYYIDKYGSLYSCNSLTWELNKAKGRDILICSNESLNSSGDIINTLRGKFNEKITLRRRSLDFDYCKLTNGLFLVTAKEKGNRHLTVMDKSFKASKNVV